MDFRHICHLWGVGKVVHKQLKLASYLKLQKKLVEEASEVAKKKGIKLIHQDMFKEVALICEKTSGNINSMLQDVLNKRRTEIDFINGAIVREGKKLNLSTPVNQVITDLIKAVEEAYQKQI